MANVKFVASQAKTINLLKNSECKRLGSHSVFLNILSKDLLSWKGLKVIV